MKQTTLANWIKKKTLEPVVKNISPSQQSSRITLDLSSSVQECQDLIAQIKGDKIVLYIKRQQIPLFVANISKDQFIQICTLGDELSPLKLKSILPDLDDAMILSLCQFLLSLRYQKLEDKKTNFFSL